jgi:dipeptidyl aminopeptidase/acylaminoacyl peptidase
MAVRRGTAFGVLAAVAALAAGCASPPAAARQGGATGASGAIAVSAESSRPSPASTVLRGDGLLAFSGGRSAGPDALYTAEPDGSRLRRMPIPAGLHPFAVAWSPDGQRLAFSALGAAGTNLYLIGSDGRGLRQLTRLGTGISQISWSPGGQQIAFVSEWDFTEAAFVVQADGTGLRRLLARFTVDSLAWGPDGRLAFSGAPLSVPNRLAIWTVGANGTGPRRISGEVTPPKLFGTLLTVYGWTADGRGLLVQSLPGYGDLSLLPATGGQPRVILHCPLRTCVPAPVAVNAPSHGNDMADAALSPDGRTVVLIVGHLNHEQLYRVPVGRGRPELIRVPGGPAAVDVVSWQPTGS